VAYKTNTLLPRLARVRGIAASGQDTDIGGFRALLFRDAKVGHLTATLARLTLWLKADNATATCLFPLGDTMTEESSSRGRPDDWSRGGYVPGEQYYGAGMGQPGMGQPGMGQPGMGQPGMAAEAPTAAIQPAEPRQAADAKGFLSALFDFSFTSFVTTKIIKVLYVLILILTSLSALLFTITSFKANATFGLLVLVIGDPLFILIVMGFWRLIMEGFIVFFRIAEDVRELRDRGQIH
jgi:hypothetical protein